MARRTHKKSRNGCIECKHRHIKCDEKRPICSNCISSQRHCGFPDPVPTEQPHSVTSEPAISSRAVVSPAVTSSPTQEPSNNPEDAPVNMLHVELVHNLSSETIKPFNHSNTPFHDIVRYGIGAPYLMNELLSLSSLHLSIMRPGHRDFYRHHSTQLQSYALSSFNSSSSQINDNNYVAVFLFAGILGVHMLCETLVYRDNDFEGFLDQFVQRGRWKLLQQTALKPILDLGARIPSGNEILGPVCHVLLDHIKGLGHNDTTTKIYKQAIQALQSVITVIDSQAPGSDSLSVLIAWPILVPREYIDLVAQRRCEALVILAYFGALVNTHKHSWVFCDGGKYLVDSITQYLGPQWEEWLCWPRQSLMVEYP
ncbi:hypothetical protein N7516_001613 [Penicillium verrucosum]|uniref:uncharacterized protein n=1 Tax=Penicillium verrucosum TaxID=60171 RepID=UPI0025453F26|nr:uncharacterized protein N7516_001613 [Penicillium verrucosum]KAJ5941445.1 hypothetical protein N7516_001613 [Penicillium verrucosum]